MANINNLKSAVASGKAAISAYKSTSLYATNAEFKNAVDTLEKQLIDQEQYAVSIKESTLFESYLKNQEYRLAEANIAIAKRDFFKANWILSQLEESAEKNNLVIKLYERNYFDSVGRLFETCSDSEADFYRSHLSEKALFGSMASQIKKLTSQIAEVQGILKNLGEITDYNQQKAEDKNEKLNAKRQDLENKTAALAHSEKGNDLIKRGKAVNKMNDITDKMEKNLAGSKANQSINNNKDALDQLKAALEDLNSYLTGDKLKKAITFVDRNTTLFGRAKVDGLATSKDFKIANMAKQIAKQAGVADQEIAAEEAEIKQEETAIDSEKAEQQTTQPVSGVSKVSIVKQALTTLPHGFTFEDYLNKCNELGAQYGLTFDATNLAKAYSPTSVAVQKLGYMFTKDDQNKYYLSKAMPPQATQQPISTGGSAISPYISESFEQNYDSILFESILYEGFFDKIKTGATALGNKVKSGVTNTVNNAKEYFANNSAEDIKQTDMNEVRATFDELANKVANFTTLVQKLQPVFNATGNSKFEVFNRKLGKVLLTAGGIVRLAGIACPPLAIVGTAMAGAGAIANGLGNTRKDALSGHKVKAAVDVIGAISGAAMGASSVGKILGKSGDILAKISGAGKTLTGVKTTVNGIDKTKNASTAAGKGMGVLSALGGVAMTLSGLSALGVQFGSGSELSAEDMTKLKQGDTELDKGAQTIINDEQVKELTAESDYIEQNPGVDTEHSDFLADTIAREVGNTNQDIAAAKVGDWIIRSDGTKVELKQFDIDYAKAAIGEIKPETNPFDPENPMVGQITAKGHMITDKDLELLKPQGSTEVVQSVATQVGEELPEPPVAPIPDEVLKTDLPPTEGVDELANSEEAIENSLNNVEEEQDALKNVDPELKQEMDDFNNNIKWSDSVNQPLQGEYRFDSVNLYGKDCTALTFKTGATICPVYTSDQGIISVIKLGDRVVMIDNGRPVVGLPGDKVPLFKVTALRNAGYTVRHTGKGFEVTDSNGQPFKEGKDFLENLI